MTETVFICPFCHAPVPDAPTETPTARVKATCPKCKREFTFRPLLP